MAQRQGDHLEALRTAEEALAIWTRLDDTRGIAAAWQSLGAVAHSQNDYRGARKCYEQALALFRELNFGIGITSVLSNLGEVAGAEGDYDEACARLTESAALARELREWRLPHILTSLGSIVHCQGNLELARSVLEEALVAWRKMGDRDGTAYALIALAEVTRDCNDDPGAQSLVREALALECDIGNPQLVAPALDLFGEIVLALAQPAAAARLWGQAERLREEFGSDVTPMRHAQHERHVATAREALDEAAFQEAWNQGRALAMDQALKYALELDVRATRSP